MKALGGLRQCKPLKVQLASGTHEHAARLESQR
jgi:hypothetical protein